jgi:hypothetical protein
VAGQEDTEAQFTGGVDNQIRARDGRRHGFCRLSFYAVLKGCLWAANPCGVEW